MKRLLGYFTVWELALWGGSVAATTVAFLLFDDRGYLSLIASLVGVTALIFCAKGNPIGQILIIAFSVLYGVISYGFRYYGEMITYLGMSAPMAVVALISWLKNPYKGKRSEVKVNRIGRREVWLMLLLTAAVTLLFYFILARLGTASLLPSALSVATSFLAVYLTFRRSPFYALAYAANDVVLIVLWVIAGTKDPSYISVIVCFLAFLVNDIYGFTSWIKMQKRQAESADAA